MKRFLALFLVLFVCCNGLSARAMSTSATSAILMDAASGRVLYAQNEHESRPIASITKLMTALVAVEHIDDLSVGITVPYKATLAGGSSMYLRSGELLTAEALLYGLLLSSGNDAAVTLAIYCGGDVAHFAGMMNEKAAALSMDESHFVNPNGLDAEGHHSSARDMARLARICMENETIATIVATKSITIGNRYFSNHNKLLWRYPDCVGMKTGYTDLAGRTLVSCAERGGRRLLVVTLNDGNDWADHAALFDYGFSNFCPKTLSRAGELTARIPVSGSLVPAVLVATETAFTCPLAAGEQVTTRLDLPRRVSAPVAAGTVLGKVTFLCNGVAVGETRLVAAASVRCDLAPNKTPIVQLCDEMRGQ